MTAEDLMRSRYSAFVFENGVYLSQTWHPDTRPHHIRFDAERTWTGLTVLSTQAGGPLDYEGVVEFWASFVRNERTGTVREESAFARLDGKWVYVQEKN